MEILAHGIDLVDFPRIEQMIQRHGKRFLNRIFTAEEQGYADASDASLSGASRVRRFGVTVVTFASMAQSNTYCQDAAMLSWRHGELS